MSFVHSPIYFPTFPTFQLGNPGKSRSRIPGIWGIFSNPNPGIICLEIPGLIKFSIPLIDRLMSAYGSEHHVMLQF